VSRVSTKSDKTTLFVDLKKEHNLAKAVKLDDAKVAVHIWDRGVCRADPTEKQAQALVKLCKFGLRVYQKRLWREIRAYMSEKFGAMEHIGLMSAGRTRSREEWREVHKQLRTSNAEGWLEQAWRVGEQVREGRMGRQSEALKQETEAVREIMWRAAGNEWFEYSLGSRLLYFRFPKRCRLQPLEGVKVWYVRKGPTSKESQPSPNPAEKEVLQRKVTKFIDRGYITPTPGC
jgi:hypothetical protein